jgi:putative methanogenesis marker protein 8
MDDEHIIEALGKSRIKVKNGKVMEVGEPEIEYCPIFDKYRGIKKISKKNVKENIEFRIKDFGFCTNNRTLKMKDFLSFGVSETLSTLMEKEVLDAVVTVCEGCGTVIITDPDLVQGIGGRVSGLVSTTPLNELINILGDENVINPETAEINQLKGVKKAIKKGYRRIGVTLVASEDVKTIKKLEEKYPGIKIHIFVAHVTGITREDAEILFKYSDVITGCASKWIRITGEEKSCFKAGDSIPIYGVTDDGEKFLKLRIEKIGGLKAKKDAKLPYPLI